MAVSDFLSLSSSAQSLQTLACTNLSPVCKTKEGLSGSEKPATAPVELQMLTVPFAMYFISQGPLALTTCHKT